MDNSRKSSISSDKEDLHVVDSSNRDSEEFKPPSLPTRSPDYSPEGSSISSDHTSLTHGSSPIPTPREDQTSPPHSPPGKLPPKPRLPAPAINRYVVGEPFSVSKMADSGGQGGRVEDGHEQVKASSGRRFRPSLWIPRRAKTEQLMKKAALGFRAFGFLFSLVSFSVMAADRHEGWALDSFDRYKEFRYCMTVNVIAFLYSGAQAVDLGYQLCASKSRLLHRFRHPIDFALDQHHLLLLLELRTGNQIGARTNSQIWQARLCQCPSLHLRP
ncbi:CASP-like protein 4A1 isoform X2 [Coffea arabica]|uniref:CASP-like protein n=1 Tax=Coffea arabica TaxID=13443 RepID=A0ABM4V6U9_COFAR